MSSEDEEGEGRGPESAFERSQRLLKGQITELETEMRGQKPWLMAGETVGKKRPENSVLEADLQFETSQKAEPIVTVERTEELEDIIKRRILDDIFDDVEPRDPPNGPGNKEQEDAYRPETELSTEKSKVRGCESVCCGLVDVDV